METYTIGIDFGSLSGRAVLVEVGTGRLAAQSVAEYTHGVMDQTLPDGTPLGDGWALQHPRDYLDVLETAVPDLLRQAGVRPEAVVGIAVDFTACTVLPVKHDGTPLCFLPEWEGHPHSYVKLWKHHAAQKQANELNRIAEERGEEFLVRYGGKISSEWMIPKLMQIAEEAPEIYEAMDRMVEAADWITMQMTGEEKRNSCTAGYKAIWHKQKGFPEEAFFRALNPRMAQAGSDKLGGLICPLGERAGGLVPELAARMGLVPGTAVAIGNVDAHVSLPALGITEPGIMLMIMGTSTCDILLGTEEKIVPGMCGVVEDGVLPGFYGYEAGQSCVGDHFAWFASQCVNEKIQAAAAREGMDMRQYLTREAAKLAPGQSGLLALDWWNGNRSCLVDADLTGLMLGMTLQTTPAQMYRALMEAIAYGQNQIIETFEASGVPVRELYACGGIPVKNPLMMQIYADVTGKTIHVATCGQAPALGAAIFGAVAAGAENGGYDTIWEAVNAMGSKEAVEYRPIPKNQEVYRKLYAEYKSLHDYFGRGENKVMKRLVAIRKEAGK